MHLSMLPARSLLHRLRGRRSPTLDQLNLTLSAVLDQSPACIIITDLTGRVLYVNPGFSRVTGYASAEVLGHPVSLIKSSRTHADTFGQLWRALQEKGEWHGELLNQRKNGESYWVAASVSALRNEDGVVDRYLSIQDDISLRKQYEAQLFHRSNYDLLTDLPNRELIQDRLQQAMDMAESQRHQVAVLFINLLQFRRVNETQGHEVGDRLLCQTAQRLQQVLSPLESLGRVGGDEFVIIMPEVSRLQAVEHLSRCILRQLAEPFRLGGDELHISACVGVSLGPEDGDNAENLLCHADAAMQQVRSRRESGCCFFREEMNARARNGLAMERALHEALVSEAFELWYQPLLDLQSGRLQGVEALVRWRRGPDEWVLPDQFIPQAEESGQIIGLGRWVLKTAVHQAAVWQCMLSRPLEMAVNVSPREVLHPGFVDDVAAVLDASGIMSGTLTLEITESIFMEPEDESRVVEILERLQGLGVKLAIDDFGTGFSALGYLKRFPVDVLKIDREFVSDIHLDMSAATLCQAIIWMAKGLQMGVVAEGVECAEQLEILKQSGARSIQGYYIAKPLESRDVLMFISQNNGYIEE